MVFEIFSFSMLIQGLDLLIKSTNGTVIALLEVENKCENRNKNSIKIGKLKEHFVVACRKT